MLECLEGFKALKKPVGMEASKEQGLGGEDLGEEEGDFVFLSDPFVLVDFFLKACIFYCKNIHTCTN